MSRRGPATLAVVGLSLAAAACLEPKTLGCAWDMVCPIGTLCNPATRSCFDPQDQLRACEGMRDYDDCSFIGQTPGASYVCREGVCILPRCGDGVVDHNFRYLEYCDPGPDLDDPTCTDECRPACSSKVPGEGYVFIPRGTYEAGCDPEEANPAACADDEQPQHGVTFTKGYCLQQTEVTVAQYRRCVDAGICNTIGWQNTPYCTWTDEPGDHEEHPVNCLEWSDAQTYCELWEGGSLPTEAQWEVAARGLDAGNPWPWGADPEPSCDLANLNDVQVEPNVFGGCGDSPDGPVTWPAGSGGAAGRTPEGLADMGGNLSEWVLDVYCPDFYERACVGNCTDPVAILEACPGNLQRGIRGGGWSTAPDAALTYRRAHVAKWADAYPEVGFRCRRDEAP